MILCEDSSKTYTFRSEKHNSQVNELISLFDSVSAEKFLRQMNVLHIVRKYLVGKGLFCKHYNDFKTRIMSLRRQCQRVNRLKQLAHFNFCEVLLAEVNDHGFLRLDYLAKIAKCTEQNLHGMVFSFNICCLDSYTCLFTFYLHSFYFKIIV